jgi:hypothetical protein
MKRDDELPIDPLPEASWNRIERGVFDELDAGPSESLPPRRIAFPRWAAVALAAAAAVQLAVGATYLLRHEPAAEPLASTRFESGAQASDALIGDVSVQLEPETALWVVESATRSSLVVLERGTARFSVPHRRERPAFVVQAGDARVEVVGTRFRVQRVGGSAEVETYEGVVRVIAAGRALQLARGQRWSGAAPAAPAASSAPAPAPTTTAAVAEAATEQLAASEPEVTPTRADGTARSGQRARFEHATALEASAPREALRAYRTLSEERGPWAQNALYALARLELELGRRARARTLLQRYLEQHPEGANAADARALLLRTAQ